MGEFYDDMAKNRRDGGSGCMGALMAVSTANAARDHRPRRDPPCASCCRISPPVRAASGHKVTMTFQTGTETSAKIESALWPIWW